MQRRICALLLCAAILLPCGRTRALLKTDEAAHDINRDGVLSDQDAAEVLRLCILGQAEKDALLAETPMDYNMDESGTAADAAVLLRYIHGDVSRFPNASGAYQPPTDEETEAAVRRILRRVMQVDFSVYAEKLAGANLNVYGDLAKNQPVFTDMATEINQTVAHAAHACLPVVAFDVSSRGLSFSALKIPQRKLAWQEAAALYRTFNDAVTEIIADTLIVNLDESGSSGAVFSVEQALFSEMLTKGTEEQQLTAKFTLAYLNTVYDDAGVQKDYEKYDLPASYLAALIHPLNNENGQYWIKDGWYDARSRRTRLHTGTDILAPARTPIHSVTDGVVLYVGYMPIPGNYVIILDPYGFEYHYYHMIEQSAFVEEGDFVSRGDVIGLVGNTGNSAANHLHLTMISPEYTYINPYDVFLAAGIKPIRVN